MINCPLCNKNNVYLVEEGFIDEQPFNIFECSFCGLSWSENIEEADEKHYNLVEWYGNRWEFKEVIKLINCEDSKILEIGCGKGFFLKMVKKKCKIYGIDINKNAINYAKKRFNLDNIYNEKLDSFLSRNQTDFDIVCAFHLLEHLKDPNDFVSKISQILKLNGFLCLSVPNPNRISLNLIGREYWDYPPHHLTRWNKKSIKYLLENSGFKILKIIEEPLSIFTCTEAVGTFLQKFFIKSRKNKKIIFKKRKKIFFNLKIFLKPIFMTLFLPIGFLIYLIGKIKRFNGQSILVVAKKQT